MQAVFIYWMTSNFYSIGQISILKVPAIKKMLNLPDVDHVAPQAQANSGSFWQNMKAGRSATRSSLKTPKHSGLTSPTAATAET